MSNQLTVQKRDVFRRSELRSLREGGLLPAVVYGKTVGSVSLAVSERELIRIMRDDPNTIIEMEVPEAGKKSVMVQSIQRDKVSRDILHVDFREVDLTEKVVASVRLETEGEAAGVKEGGVLRMDMHEIEVECLPKDIPQQITIDISNLGVGDSLFVKDIALPPDVTAVTESEQIVAQVLPPQKAETEETDDAADGEEAQGGEDGGEGAE